MTRRHAAALVLFVLACLAVLADASTRQAQGSACPTGRAGSYVLVKCKNQLWHCTGKQDHTQVDVEISNSADKIDGVHLDSGCTGVIRVAIDTDSGDGIKIHQGAHDLEVWGYISCSGKHGSVHQDGVQAMGGRHVTLKWMRVTCPTGNNGGLFCRGGKGGNDTPTDIVAEHGTFYEGNAAIHVGDNSNRCGARWVHMRTNKTKASPAGCIRIDHAATDPVNEQNVCETPK